MDLRGYVAFLKRRWWLLILGPIIAALTAVYVTKDIVPEYRATAQIFVMNQSVTQLDQVNGLNQPQPGINGLQVDDKLTNTYVRLVERRPVLEAVIAQLALPITVDDLQSKISASGIEETQLILLNAEDPDPVVAAALANATAQQFVADIDRQLGRTGTMSISEQATPPGAPFKPSLRTNVMLAVVLGLLVAGAIAVSLEYLDDTIKTSADLQKFGLTTVGVIPHFRNKKTPKRGRTSGNWTAPVIEDFRELRTNIQFVDFESRVKTIVVTSFGEGEGKSTVAANLASVLAQAGERVVLIDSDLRRPMLHDVLGTPNSYGLTGLLLNDPNNWLSALTTTVFPYMVFLPSGPIPPNPSELLTSQRMTDLVTKLKMVTDFIIFDTPPVGSVTDATVLAHAADGVLLVVEPGRTRNESVTEALSALNKVNAKLIGAVMNKQHSSRRRKGSAYGGALNADLHAPLPDAVARLQTLVGKMNS